MAILPNATRLRRGIPRFEKNTVVWSTLRGLSVSGAPLPAPQQAPGVGRLTAPKFTSSGNEVDHCEHETSVTEAPKILLLGLNRSGTTALAYRVFDAISGRKVLAFEPRTLGGAQDSEFHRKVTAKSQAVVTKCLIYPTNKTNWDAIYQNSSLYQHRVWVARDPRDVMISSFFYHWYSNHRAPDDLYQIAHNRVRKKEQNPSDLSFLQIVSGTLTNNADQLAAWQGSWYDHLCFQFDSIEKHLDVVHYEEIVANNTSGLDKATGLQTGRDFSLPQNRQRVARTRSSGNWRYWFTEQDVEFFRPLFSKYLLRAGYDADDWTLEPKDSIASIEASEYMTKIRTTNAIKRVVSVVKQSAQSWYHAYKPV